MSTEPQPVKAQVESRPRPPLAAIVQAGSAATQTETSLTEGQTQAAVDALGGNLFSLAWSSVQPGGSRIAWGDVDADGDLDLATGGLPARLYSNKKGILTSTPTWLPDEYEPGLFGGWTDLNQDTYPDLIVATPDYALKLSRLKVYFNQEGRVITSAAYSIVVSDIIWSMAWGDQDGDGDPDLAVGTNGSNKLYRNDNGILTASPVYTFPGSNNTEDLAWGDYDNDGDLDLVLGNRRNDNTPDGKSQLFRNDGVVGGVPKMTLVWEWGETDNTSSVAWGDVDGDGDLDLAVGHREFQRTQIFRNDGVVEDIPQMTLAWFSNELDHTVDLAWGDYDSDGDLDLAVANAGAFPGAPDRLYQNRSEVGGPPQMKLVWSSAETDDTISIAWGDYDGDGDLDLAAQGQLNRLYRNETVVLASDAAFATTEVTDIAASTAWGDYDRDGDLDLAVGNGCDDSGTCYPNRLYRNDNGTLTPSAVYATTETDYTFSVAWGDYDGDGDLDLAVGNYGQPNRLYRNDGGSLTPSAVYFTDEADWTTSVAWGDYDGDGDLDLMVGNRGQPNRLYRNDGGSLTSSAVYTTTETGWTTSVVWGDVDGDGDLDLAVGNNGQPNRLYRNDAGVLTPSAVWSSDEVDATFSVAWGDYDGDGHLDLAVGNWGPNRLYHNDGETLATTAQWSSVEADITFSVAWGDYDGDDDLDLAVGNTLHVPNRLYRNDGIDSGSLTPSAVWSSDISDPRTSWTTSVAWGDVDGDGDLDLAAADGCLTGYLWYCRDNIYQPFPTVVYYNLRDARSSPKSVPLVRVNRPGANANFYSAQEIWSGPTIAITYTLSHPASDPVRLIRASYSPDGGGHWLPATATNTLTQNLTTSPTGEDYVYHWDTSASGFFGQSDNVVFRIEAVPTTINRPNSVPGPYLYGRYASDTFPFRVRGTQVRVVDENNEGVSDALVYRLPGGQPIGGAETPFRTSSTGYLAGRDMLNEDDELIALRPITVTDKFTLYHTSAAPTQTGLGSHTVTSGGVQTLTVTTENPLLLFDLDVSLEWDASKDPSYLTLLKQNLAKTSKALYDWTNGQVALGQVTVYQARDHWNEADIRIFASNQMRPVANRGGIVTETTVLNFTEPLTFSSGEIRLGPTWNRYGEPEPIGDDWPKVLAHELGHYALFLEDTYLGLEENTGLLIPVSSCTGTAMTDPYDDVSSEFRYHDANWDLECGETLAEMSDWELIEQIYPALHQPPPENIGPATMPFVFTQIEIKLAPAHPAPLLDDDTVVVEDADLHDGRAYLIHPGEGMVDLGRPALDSIPARGAHEGDKLCIFATEHFACSDLHNSEPANLTPQSAWQPDIVLTPVNTTTLKIMVADGSHDTLNVTLYPNGAEPQNEIITAGEEEPLILNQPAVEVLVDIVGNDSSERVVTGYTLGAGPGRKRGHGGPGRKRGHGGPFSSGDGDVVLYPPQNLPDDVFMTLQLATTLPDLPSGLQAIGQAYYVRPSAPVADYSAASLTFQYLGLDVLLAGGPQGEENLAVHYWDGSAWTRLDTSLNKDQNFASAPLPGPGLYVLTVGRLSPTISSVSPTSGISGLPHTLTITGVNFLPPLAVSLQGDLDSQALTVTSASTQTLVAQTPISLSADLYDLELTNSGGLTTTLPAAFALYTASSPGVCFFDDFKSGLGRWTVTGDWDIVPLADSREAVTDSPGHPYPSAEAGSTLTTTITSASFNLAECGSSLLHLQHDYELVTGDQIIVEISSDDGASWQSLATYQGRATQAIALATQADEWQQVQWQTLELDLAEASIPLDTTSARLRFTLQVDDFASAKGWIIDEVSVGSSAATSAPSNQHFLPLLVK
ncbi:MAG: VCBS repeat-containing protein [Anaerolineae bacterium]|nr:VCBS repeat-containing protein [Anaerolineae bacterium]